MLSEAYHNTYKQPHPTSKKYKHRDIQTKLKKDCYFEFCYFNKDSLRQVFFNIFDVQI